MKKKVLNLYAGIGGNRKLWQNVDVTAVEYRKDIADVYSHYFPEDNMVIGDAHQYLLDHYGEFDFIWSSFPCQSHSRARLWNRKSTTKYPDLRLYEEIIFLQHYCKKPWVIENVVPFYEPLIKPSIKLGRHLFWSNFTIYQVDLSEANVVENDSNDFKTIYGFNLSNHKIQSRKDQIYRNCVHPETGLHILNCAMNIQPKTTQLKLI